MIEIERIRTSDVESYKYMENLLKDSFPPEEYRDMKQLKEYVDNSPIFFWNIIRDNNKPVGLISYWDLDDFYYVEHLAVDTAQRNGGYGKKILDSLSATLDRPIVLEVELPTEEMAVRRINFYKRQGYALWERDYMQPPYKKDSAELPMHLMVYGNMDMEEDFEMIKNKIYGAVYNVDK